MYMAACGLLWIYFHSGNDANLKNMGRSREPQSRTHFSKRGHSSLAYRLQFTNWHHHKFIWNSYSKGSIQTSIYCTGKKIVSFTSLSLEHIQPNCRCQMWVWASYFQYVYWCFAVNIIYVCGLGAYTCKDISMWGISSSFYRPDDHIITNNAIIKCISPLKHKQRAFLVIHTLNIPS